MGRLPKLVEILKTDFTAAFALACQLRQVRERFFFCAEAGFLYGVTIRFPVLVGRVADRADDSICAV